MAEETKNKKTKRPTAQKRQIQSVAKFKKNHAFKSKVRTARRQLLESLTKSDQEETQANLAKVYSLLDKGVKRGVYSKNLVARQKSRLTKKLAV